MYEKAYVFERPNGAIGVMLLAKDAQPMLDKMKAVGWRGTIDWWTTEFSFNGGPRELPAVIKLPQEKKYLEVVRFVNRAER
jgi:hypothetical protein